MMSAVEEMTHRILSLAILTAFVLVAVLCSIPAHAATIAADRSNDNVLQGNFETGASDVFLQDNSNARRVGTGGAGGQQRVNHPVLGFTLPTLVAGEPITNVTFSTTMDTTAVQGAPIGFDMVVCLMNQTSISGFTAADFVETNAPVNSAIGNGIVIGHRTTAEVANNSVESFSLTGAALAQFAALYDGAGNPLQSEVWFRLSTSDWIDTTVAANDNDRFNFARNDAGSGNLVTRSLEIITVASTPPEILVQPQDTEVVLGAAQAEVSVTANGQAPLAYQWFFGASELTGETNNTLTILNPGAAELGDYSETVTNSLGSTNSDSATLSYVAGPITPGDGAAAEGGTVTYGVDLPQAATNYTYQWALDTIALGGETNAELVLNPVELADAGNYTVGVTYDGITETSEPVILLVGSAASDYTTTVLADSPTAWWRLGELSGSNALDSAGSAGGPYDGVYLPAVQLDQAGALLGDTDRSAGFTGVADSKVSVDFSEDLNPASGEFSVEAWVLVEGLGGQRPIVTSLDDYSNTEKYGYTLTITSAGNWRFGTGRYAPPAFGLTTADGPAAVPLEWTHLVGVYSGSSNTLYVNGYPVASVSVTDFEYVQPGNFEVPLWIGAVGADYGTPGPGTSFFDGLIDEVAFYGSALSGADVLEHYAAGLPSDAPPQFNLEPGDVLSDISGQVTFTVAVRSVGEPTYQWQKDGVDIPGATMTSLTLTNLTLMDEGGYRALADVAGNVVTSSVGNLTIRPPSTVLLENFETYSTGVFGDVASSNWVLDAAIQTNWWTVEDEGGNQYLRMLGKDDTNTTTTIASLNMGDSNQVATATNGVPTEGISTVFLRFYYESGVDNGLWWGTSDDSGSGFGGLRGSTSSRQTTPPGLSVRTGASTVILTSDLSYDTWYNMWQVHDNDADTMQVYLTTGGKDATLADRFEVNGVFAFPFRTDGATDVSVDPLNYYRFISRTRAAAHRVDDIYISTGINLDNPLSLGPLRISVQGGSPEVTWTDAGTLQRTEDPVGGSWTDLPAATSPYTPPVGPDTEHFRIRE